MKTLVVVPAYNEQECIERTVQQLRESGYDFVVINDGSTDDTEGILVRLGAPHVRLINNLGIGGCVQTGYRYAYESGYEIAVQFDGDGQHDASYIGRLIKPIEQGEANLVIGSRFIGNESKFMSTGARRAGIKLLSWVLHAATGVQVHDVTSGFRAVDKRVLALFAESYPIDYPEPESIASVVRQGLTVMEVPVAMREREGGASSIAGLDVVWYMVKVGLSILLHGSYRGRG